MGILIRQALSGLLQAGWQSRREPIIRFRSSYDSPDIQEPHYSDCIVPFVWCASDCLCLQTHTGARTHHLPGRFYLSSSMHPCLCCLPSSISAVTLPGRLLSLTKAHLEQQTRMHNQRGHNAFRMPIQDHESASRWSIRDTISERFCSSRLLQSFSIAAASKLTVY